MFQELVEVARCAAKHAAMQQFCTDHHFKWKLEDVGRAWKVNVYIYIYSFFGQVISRRTTDHFDIILAGDVLVTIL